MDEKFQHAMAKFRNAAYEITTNGPVPTKVDYSTGSCTVAFNHSIRNIAIILYTNISYGQKNHYELGFELVFVCLAAEELRPFIFMKLIRLDDAIDGICLSCDLS